MISKIESVEKMFVLALKYQKAGDLSMASQIYQNILAVAPEHTASIGNLALIVQHSGNNDLSIKLLKKLISLEPNDTRAYSTLGNAYYHHGCAQTAIECYKKVLELAPESTSAFADLGITYQHIGDFHQAVSYLKRGLELDANSGHINFCLGNVYYESANYKPAIHHYKKVIQVEPDHSEAYANLALSYKALKQNNLAIDSIKIALELTPNSSNFHYNLGNIYQQVGKPKRAILCYQKAIQIKPRFSQAYINLGNILRDLGRRNKAIEYLKEAVRLAPGDPDVYYNLGLHLSDLNDYKKSSHFYQIAIGLRSKQAVSNYLMDLNYYEQIDPKLIFDNHLREAKKLHIDPLSNDPISVPRQDGYKSKIKIGYLSSDFRNHSVACFFQPIVEFHNRDEFEVFCFSNSSIEDEITNQIRTHSDHFIPIHHLSDVVAFQKIKSQDLDFLIDLNGHTSGNRLAILRSGLAKKVLSWIGYPTTTGLSTVDYKISDNYCDPAPFTDQFYAEDLLRLDGFFMVYKPPNFLPEIQPSPCFSNGYLTFGCFNNFKKINHSLIRMWSRALLDQPHSRLILKNSGKPNQQQKEIFLDFFYQSGVDDSRIKFFDRMESRVDHLNLYNLVDISLDTYPYSGTTTTFESLLMGVPVFTMVGQTHVSRVTGSILDQLDLHQFTVSNFEDYVPELRQLAQKKCNFDRSYRQRLIQSNLCDGLTFVRGLETKLKHVR